MTGDAWQVKRSSLVMQRVERMNSRYRRASCPEYVVHNDLSSLDSNETDEIKSEMDRNTFAGVHGTNSLSSSSVQHLYMRFIKAYEATLNEKASFRLFHRPKYGVHQELDFNGFLHLFPLLKVLPQATVNVCWRLFHPFDAVTCIQIVQFLHTTPHQFIFDWFTAKPLFSKLKKKNTMTRKELQQLINAAHLLSPASGITIESFPENMNREEFIRLLPMSVVRTLIEPFAIFPSNYDERAILKTNQETRLQFAIAMDWWQSWQLYTNKVNESNQLEEDYRPHSIYNSYLADAIENEVDTSLVEGKDYALVTPAAWKYLIERYGGGPMIPCFNGNYSAPQLQIYLAENDGRPSPKSRIIYVDPTIRLVKMLPDLAKLHQVSATLLNMRLWYRSSYNSWSLVSPQLSATDVDWNELLLEVRSGSEWPRDKLRSPRDFRPLRIGDPVDAFDCERTWRPAVVHRISPDGSRVLVNFVGFHAMYNEWIHHDSGKLQPRHSRTDPDDRNLFWQKSTPVLNPGQAGALGLLNLGNTCFLNCAIQCLSATPILRQYLLSGQYLKHINRSNTMGTKGKIIQSLANVVGALWANTGQLASSTVSPSSLRKLFAKCRQQFDSYDQQDAHEYIASLLDALHEDVKRPLGYTDSPRSHSDIETESDAAWQKHIQSNHSIITDVFHGQLRSQTICDQCSHRTVAFDPFLFFSLSIPLVYHCKIRVLVFLQGLPPQSCDVTLPNNEGNLEIVIKAISAQVQVSEMNLRLIHVQNHRFVRVLSNEVLICDVEGAMLYCFERMVRLPIRVNEVVTVPVDRGRPTEIGVIKSINADTFDVCMQRDNQIRRIPMSAWYNSVRPRTKEGVVDLQVVHQHQGHICGIPFVLSLGSERTSAQLHAEIARQLSRVIFFDGTYNLLAMAFSNPGVISLLPNDDSPFLSHVMPPQVIVVDWQVAPPKYKEDWDALMQPEPKDETLLTLDMCLETFMKSERMNDQWTCEHCHENNCGTRFTDLSRAPDILMLHFKRFHYSSVQHHKVNELVTFPLDGLDIRQYMMPLEAAAIDPNECIYDLYAVANHTGGLTEGHYTVYCRYDIIAEATENFVPVEHTWLCCDDEVVSEIPPSKVVSNAAYVLFYKRRQSPYGYQFIATKMGWMVRLPASAKSSLLQNGFLVIDNALDSTLAHKLLQEIQQLHADNQLYTNATHVYLKHQPSPLLLEKKFISETELLTVPSAFTHLQQWFDNASLRHHLNHLLPELHADRHMIKVQYNEGRGGCFPMHYDTYGDDGKCLTAVLYLNEHWKSGDGGEIVLYPFPYTREIIAPMFNRLVLFSSNYMLHRVLPSNVPRYCLTTWLYRDPAAPSRTFSPQLRPDQNGFEKMMAKLCASPFRLHLSKLYYANEWKQSLIESHADTTAFETYMANFDQEIDMITQATDKMLKNFEKGNQNIPPSVPDFMLKIKQDFQGDDIVQKGLVTWF